MAETTQSDRAHETDGIAAAARDRGMEQLEGAKAQLADGAERVAAAVERTAEELDGEGGDGGLSGAGRSIASLMRQLAGGLRERDVDDFARELASLARRNPGVFLAGSVALGFGVARFFKARVPQSSPSGGGAWRDSASRQEESRAWQPESSAWDDSGDRRYGGAAEFDSEDSLDLSASAGRRASDSRERGLESTTTDAESGSGTAATGGMGQHDTSAAAQGTGMAGTAQGSASGSPSTAQGTVAQEASKDDERDPTKPRASGSKNKRGGKS